MVLHVLFGIRAACESREDRDPAAVLVFEFFPPRDDAAEQNLLETIRALKPLDRASSRSRTAPGAPRARARSTSRSGCGWRTASTSWPTSRAGARRRRAARAAEDLRRCDIENIMALRGDPPRGDGSVRRVRRRAAHASDLIALLKAEFPFCVGAAAIRRSIRRRPASTPTSPRCRPKCAPARSSW